jgi:uncharacterized protein YjbI with pentapeptide repeats
MGRPMAGIRADAIEAEMTRPHPIRLTKLGERQVSKTAAQHELLYSGRAGGARAVFAFHDLSGMDLSGRNLTEADFTGACLDETDLSESQLYSACFAGASMSRGNLARASLRRANLSGTMLEGANLIGANLSEADMREGRAAYVVFPCVSRQSWANQALNGAAFFGQFGRRQNVGPRSRRG